MSVNLETKLGALNLKNPVLTASGTFGFGEEYAQYFDLSQLGGIMVKGTTLHAREGNPAPRITETPAGMLNAIGLQNPGLDVVLNEKLLFLRQFDTTVIVNISGQSIDEYVILARRLSDVTGVHALELNISCPNVKVGGMQFGVEPSLTRELVSAVREVTPLPLITKLSPNVTDIVAMAQAAVEGGTDIISLINTLLGMAIDVDRRRPVLANMTGGLSGPAIRPVAVRMVWQVAQAVKVPIIGMGGIMNTHDALEFILAGASAIAVGTGNFINPTTSLQVIEGLKEYCTSQGISKLSELTGAALPH